MELKLLEKRVNMFFIVLIILNLIQSCVIGYLILGINEETDGENVDNLPYIHSYQIKSSYDVKSIDNTYRTYYNFTITIVNYSDKIYTRDSLSINIMTIRRTIHEYIYLKEIGIYPYLLSGPSSYEVTIVPETYEGLPIYIVLFLNGVEIDRKLFSP